MKPTIGILGGTGHEEKGLALRWAHAAYPVVIRLARFRACRRNCSRNRRAVGSSVVGATNVAAAESATICVLTVPYAAHRATLEAVRHALSGKILVDVTVPLLPPKVTRVQLPPEDSAAVAAQTILGPDVKVVSAFQNVSAHYLETVESFVDCDVLVCGDDKDARESVVALARAAGMRGIHGGVLANSAAAEALTSVLIFLNGRYKVKVSGIRFTGIPDDSTAT
jgi:8-hydroxy-5-deazaflavin:NADPH oxidoreductase